MKVLFTVLALACLTSAPAAYADYIIPYNLCADKTKTDCQALHMPTLGQIDSLAGSEVSKCGEGCLGDATFKAADAAKKLFNKAGKEFNPKHYLTFEDNADNLVYIQPDPDVKSYERIAVSKEVNGDNTSVHLSYCIFNSENISATIEKYKKEKNVQAGVSLIDIDSYNELKTAFQAKNDANCEGLNP